MQPFDGPADSLPSALRPARSVSFGAVAGFLLSLSVVGGLLGLLVSVHALRQINRSDGRLGGQKLAVAGLLLGVVGTLLSVLGLVAVVLVHLRERSGRVECQNHLRHVGLALGQYHDEHQAFPPGTVPNEGLPPHERLSWYVLLLPYLGAEMPPLKGSKAPPPPKKTGKQPDWQLLYRGIDLSEGWQAPANAETVRTSLRWLRCPSSSERQPPDEPALTNYVGIAGVGVDAALLPVTSPDAGVFGYNREVSRTQVTRGISQTMMVTETAWRLGPWAAGGPATVRGLDPNDRPYLGVGRPFGGLHADGLNVLFVDGSVQFVHQTVDPRLFEQMATIRAQRQERGGGD